MVAVYNQTNNLQNRLYMKKEIILSGRYEGKLTVDYTPCINYAMVHNHHNAFHKFILRNTSGMIWKDVVISISGDVIDSVSQVIPILKPGKAVSLEDFYLMPTITKLMALTECVQTSFCVTIISEGEQIMRNSFPLTILAFNQWHGLSTVPELVASFVTPNHPKIQELSSRASRLLEEMSGDKGLDDYQSGDKLRIAKQIEAVYDILKEEKLTYAAPPASFEATGQRIRLVDHVLNTRQGSCLDLSVLLCSCLENIGLNTMIVMFDTHAFMGVWTEGSVATPMAGYDVKFLKESIRNDNLLILIDATALTRNASLTEAINAAETYVEKNAKDFNLFVDIQSARNHSIKPLPHCVLTETGWIVEEPGDACLCKPTAPQLGQEIHGAVSPDKMRSKVNIWERKLLDLTLRNNLLNMKPTNGIVPFRKMPVDDILKAIRTNSLLDLLDVKDTEKTVKELYRASRNSIEENGANTLFLSIGTLKWFEDGADSPYLAPIVFIPVEIARQSPRKYVASMRDEEPMVNTTLLEMLRQNFDVETPDTCNLMCQDNASAQWKAVLAELKDIIADINRKRKDDSQWVVTEDCRLGIFSFAKFVIWNDVHNNPEVLEAHPIIQSLIEGRSLLGNDESDENARELDVTSKPSDFAIPLDVDSSQLEAIAASGKGRSFILHGPPGTGKSQTITNMIANALYQNKRVLFVAEKKAALEVVQERLKRIGLAPFCMELHSNKAEKKSFLAQAESAVNAGNEPMHPFFEKYSDELYAKRCELNAYINSLHQKREQGLSLYEYINKYQELDGNPLPLSYSAISHLNIEKVGEVIEQLRALDKVVDVLGEHPSMCPLRGLYPLHNTADNQKETIRLLALIPAELEKAERKSSKFIYRHILRRTAMEIFSSTAVWKDLCKSAEIDDEISSDMDRFSQAVSLWHDNTDKLRLWYHFSMRVLSLKEYNVSSVLDYFMQGHSGQDTANAFEKGYYLRMATEIIEEDPSLRAFNGLLFEDAIKQFRRMNRNFQKLTIQDLRHRITSRINEVKQDHVLSEELTILRKRISSNGRGTSVRRILEQTRHVLPTLCPCMLMSPLSVSQYLDMRNNQFDLVIFDEASQMPTCEAIGAIARGKAVVVVGDPMQMPPTSFFMANTTTDNDIDVDDLESILHDCMSLSLPNKYLSWHYRSRHESLIAFSNTHFYSGRLITFPSVDDQERKVSLQYVNGTYDFGNTRCNRIEARSIVDYVIEHLASELPPEEGGHGMPHRSIGIVAFNKNQSNLIEDMLMEALARNRTLEEIALKCAEPIFVKNLENVQGDERDVILFSVGYGPDKNGKVSMNFGPLNQMGGERRLNVAVSRARYEMKVFSALRPDHIDLQRTEAKGVKALKQFLEYAETGVLPCPLSQLHSQEVIPIIDDIASELEKKGYEVHKDVGSSRFHIDVAIVDKANPSRYAMGIIVDTEAYYNAPTACDRNIIQPGMLESLGWNLHHIWTVDWVENPEQCIRAVTECVDR